MWYPWVLWQTEAHFTCKSFVRVTSLSWYSGTFSVLALEVLHSGSPLSAGQTGTVGHPISWDSPSASSLNPVSISLYCLNHGGPPPPIQLLRADSRDLNSDNWAEVSPIQGAGGMASLSPTCSTTIKTALLSACNRGS